ncbi:MAG: prolyl-tRNA synthetase associated domain-containing protein [Oscillospiraceae bacterium]
MHQIHIDPTLYSGPPASLAGRDPVEVRCYEFLDKLSIPYRRLDHDHTDTIEDCHEVEKLLGIRICKNLFLCNRQGTKFYLLLMPGDKPFKTKTLSKRIGTSRLSFASAENMSALLGLRPGSVTVLGLINDTEQRVHLIIDRPVLEDEYFGCHPCVSTSSLKIAVADLLERLLPALGVTPTIVDLPDGEDA